MAKQTKKPLAESLKELESIVTWFDDQEKFDLEIALTKIQQGAELITTLKEQLKSVENQFKEVKKQIDA
jgi:exonuclease VII small subunit